MKLVYIFNSLLLLKLNPLFVHVWKQAFSPTAPIVPQAIWRGEIFPPTFLPFFSLMSQGCFFFVVLDSLGGVRHSCCYCMSLWTQWDTELVKKSDLQKNEYYKKPLKIPVRVQTVSLLYFGWPCFLFMKHWKQVFCSRTPDMFMHGDIKLGTKWHKSTYFALIWRFF